MTDLANCPFCGNAPVIRRTMQDYPADDVHPAGQYEAAVHVCCGTCGFELVEEYQSEAIAAWNRRASSRTSEAEPVAWQSGEREMFTAWLPKLIAALGSKPQHVDDVMRLARLQYLISLPTPASDDQVEAVRDVLAERKRQVDVEHWMPGHDDQHTGGELAQAAAAYAYYGTEAENSQPPAESIFPTTWDMSWWKPGDHRRNLVKAGALIIAEIERLDRLAAMGSTKR